MSDGGGADARRTIRRRPTAEPPPSDAGAQPAPAPAAARPSSGSAETVAPRRAIERKAAEGRSLDHRVVLLAILVVAGLVRLGGAWTGTPCTLTDLAEVAAEAAAGGECVSYNDSVTYLTDARLNADGEWFHTQSGDGPPYDTALHAPLFSVALTPLIWAGIDSYDALRIAVSLFGVAAVALVLLLGRAVAGARVGLVAAALAAVHPLVWINDVVLMPEGLFAGAVAGVAILAYRFRDDPTTARALAFGAGIGGAGLLRNEALLAVGFIALPLVMGMHSATWTERARRIAIVVAGVGLVLAPWVGFNWARFDQPLLTNGTGAGLRVGTCDETFYNDRLLGLRSVDCLEVDGKELRALDEADEIGRSELFQDGAIEYYQDNLGRTPTVVMARVARFWGMWRPFETVRLDDAIEQRGAQRAQVGVLVGWALTPLAAYGAVVLWRRRVPLSPLLGWIATSTVLAAANQPLQRFRIGGDVALVVLAAVGLVAVAARPGVRRMFALEPEPDGAPAPPSRPTPSEGRAPEPVGR